MQPIRGKLQHHHPEDFPATSQIPGAHATPVPTAISKATTASVWFRRIVLGMQLPNLWIAPAIGGAAGLRAKRRGM